MTQRVLSRRRMLSRTGVAAASLAALGPGCAGHQTARHRARRDYGTQGSVTGEEYGARVGQEVFAEGGNAVDAAVAAALAACIATPSRCGIGGYGGHMTLYVAAKREVISIDFNSTAPAAAHADMYPLDETGAVKGQINFHGWLAAGVPGTLAGLQYVLDHYGTRSFRELVEPAIALAEYGFVATPEFVRAVEGASRQFRADPGSAALYLAGGTPPKAGAMFRNPDLAAMLTTLAERNSVESFYRGDIALRLAEAYQKNGGLVTARDLAAYRVHEVKPLALRWGDYEIFTAPLTAGGLSALEALRTLESLGWTGQPASPEAAHARLEALRLAWKDRLELLGDPAFVNVPVDQLLSQEYAGTQAMRIGLAVRARKPLTIEIATRTEDGTNNFSASDGHGNLVALTLAHGSGFGAQVTAAGLGLTLGHGMSRFDPRPGHPNAPGPGKKPLHNMCPTVVLRGGKPALALGGAGGVKILNALFDVLTHYVILGESMTTALAGPRQHTLGSLKLAVEPAWPKADADYLRQIGFDVRNEDSARISAASYYPDTGATFAMTR